MSAAAGVVALNALVLVVGAGLLAALGWPRPVRAWPGLSFMAGAAVVGVAGQLLLVAGLPLTGPAVVAIALACVGAGVLRRRVHPSAAAGVPRLHPRERAAFAPVTALLLLIGALAAVKPLDRWDAWAFWTPKAKSLVVFGGLEPAYFASGVPNPDYPLLVPALESLVFRFVGSFDTQLVHVEHWLLLAGLVAAAFELLRGLARPTHVALVLTLLVLTPATYGEALSAYADVPLAGFVALAAVSCWRWLHVGEGRMLAATALFAAAAMATKVEGRIFVAALFVTLAVLALRRSRRSAAHVATAGGAALIGLVPWELWRRTHGISAGYDFDAGRLLERLPRVPEAAERLAVAVVDPRSWLFLAPALVLLLAVGARGPRRSAALLVAGTGALSFAGLTLVYWNTPQPFEWHLDTSVDRVVISLVYVAAALAPVLLSAEAPSPQTPTTSSGRTGTRVSSRPVASRSAATIAAVDTTVGGSPTPLTP